MADHHSSHNGTTVRGIDYKSTFPFVNLFKGFRLAIDPSKIVLALALLLLVYAGGRILDGVWPDHSRAIHGELASYANANDPDQLAHDEARRQAGLIVSPRTNLEFANDREDVLLARENQVRGLLQSLGHKDWAPTYGNLVRAYAERRDNAISTYDKNFASTANKSPEARNAHDEAVRQAYAEYARDITRTQSLANEGLFIHFLQFETNQVDSVVWYAVNLNLPGVLQGLQDFFLTAPAWAFRHHTVFSIIFFAWLLILWSIFAGAISRIAAVQVARDEKISIRQALRFSTGKVLSFIFAPLIPAIIIGVLGLILAVASILISVPGLSGIWSVVIGAIFFLALLAGLVMMLTAVGLIGGGHLMYPTIAAEGSDSFDAVSRSFSYLYARPWQLAFYSLVSLVYGAITFLVVRLALYVLLLLVHGSINLFQWGHAMDGTPIVDAMWPRPTNFMTLMFETNYPALGPVQTAGAGLMSFWIYLAISVLGAYVISLYLSSGTLIYFLLRRDVDATEMDEVYLEPNDDELADAAAATNEPTAETPTATEPAGQPVDTVVPPPASDPTT